MVHRDITEGDIASILKLMPEPSHPLESYTEALANEILEKLAVSRSGLTTLCKENPHWPNRSTILKWRIRSQTFADKYQAAKQFQIEALIDQTLDISDDSSKDTKIRYDANGEEYEVPDSEVINRSRLRIAARQWLAERLVPKIYGTKTTTDTNINVRHEEAIKELG